MNRVTVFHMLPEDEPFSASRGGAISRVVANLVGSDASATILCSSSDGSWRCSPAKASSSFLLRVYGNSSALHSILLKIKPLLRILLLLVTRHAKRGDVLWIHNRVGHAILLNKDAAKRGIRLVLHMHNHTVWKPEMAAHLPGVRLVFVSHALADEALALCPALGAIEVLHNGADPAVFHPDTQSTSALAHSSMQVLFVGRLIAEKGAHVLIAAMRLLEQRAVPVHLRIVGSAAFAPGGRSPYIDALTASATPGVTIEGYRTGEALAQIYREADVFCCPSVWAEPFGLVLVEAMATGVPVVATSVGGIPEVLAFGGGILVPPDSAEALAQALERLAEDRLLRLEMGREALLSFTQHFAWQVIQERYQMIVSSL
jgi:glycosyltransferase involved in cell wall biosynthesis